MQNTAKTGYLCALGAVLIWSGFILVSRMGGISSLSAYDVIAIRYLSCSILVLPIWLIWKPFNLFRPKLIIISLIGGLAYALFTFTGFKTTPASHAAVLLPGLLPLSIALLASWLNKEKHSRNKCLGIAIISAGIAVLFALEIKHSGSLSSGHLALTAAALCWATFSVLINRWDISPWEATVSLALVTSCVFLPIYLLWLPSNLSMNLLHEIAIQAFYQGFLASIVQMLLYVRAVQLIGAAHMGSLMAIVPILAGFSAIPIFNEHFSPGLAIALLLVSVGVLLANTKSGKRNTELIENDISEVKH